MNKPHFPFPPALSLGIERLARRRKPLLVLAATEEEASNLAQEISFWGEIKPRLMPDWETLPWDHFSPHPDIISERLSALTSLLQASCDIVVAAISTAALRLPPPAFLAARVFCLERGQPLEQGAFRKRLALGGYQAVQEVLLPGEYAVRGGIIDVFPMGSESPLRLEFGDDVLLSLRPFDPETQRSQKEVDKISVLPAREFPMDEAARSFFRKKWRERFGASLDPRKSPFYEGVTKGFFPGGIEYFLPLFFEATASLFDYLPPEGLVILAADPQKEFASHQELLQERHKLLAMEKERLLPEEISLTPEEFFRRLGQRTALEKEEESILAAGALPLPALAMEPRSPDPFLGLRAFLQEREDLRALLLAPSAGRREALLALLHRHGISCEGFSGIEDFLASSSALGAAEAPLSQGFIWTEKNLALICEPDLFKEMARPAQSRKTSRVESAFLRELALLSPGDPVVHETHGVGRYRGLETVGEGDEAQEFVVLEYKGGDRLFVPVTDMDLLTRYLGAAAESAPWHRLGGEEWEKEKKRAWEEARDSAAELLEIAAKRNRVKDAAISCDAGDYARFCEGFPFEPTFDQARVIDAVLADLARPEPMDRLVCGDVGFGKTEVALRAAFVAAVAGFQVAVLVPTTLLAEQHFETFAARLAGWPIEVVLFSRFRGRKDTEESLARLAQGQVDIAIGTHLLLQDKVLFKRLGLVVVDEEHRFGVRQKEKLKSLRAQANFLTLTATPIPRTLSLAMERLRDLSLITTPPPKRLAVKTFVVQKSDSVIREAVWREARRGGQVYYISNDVLAMEREKKHLEAILPGVRIGIAHGQMRERELEAVMRDFTLRRLQVLLASTIVETGIDIPNANTILIDRADKLGLAQLHQLRGRVGRSHHQAYAYLLLPDPQMMTPEAKRRIEAAQSLGDLGAGFQLAMLDMEIRGAGEILGEAQSGKASEVGLSLYAEMLERATQALLGEKPAGEPLPAAEVRLREPALLPAAYCVDVATRLKFYRRLAAAQSQEDLMALEEEIVDRLGPLPEAARRLMTSHRLRLMAKALGIRKIEVSSKKAVIVFSEDTPVDGQALLPLLEKESYRFRNPQTLEITTDEKRGDAFFLERFLGALEERCLMEPSPG